MESVSYLRVYRCEVSSMSDDDEARSSGDTRCL